DDLVAVGRVVDFVHEPGHDPRVRLVGDVDHAGGVEVLAAGHRARGVGHLRHLPEADQVGVAVVVEGVARLVPVGVGQRQAAHDPAGGGQARAQVGGVDDQHLVGGTHVGQGG